MPLRAGEVAVLAVLAVVLVTQLFVPHATGVADNSDFHRLLAWYGMDHRADGVREPLFDYVDLRYERVIGQAPLQLGYPSSGLLFLTGARVAALLIGDDGLDIRLSGLAHGLGWLAAWGLLLVASRPLRPSVRWTFLGVLTLMTADGAYVAYLNTFYSEPASLVFLLATVAAGLHLSFAPTPRAALLLAAAGFGLVASKPQYAPVGIVLAGVLLLARPVRTRAVVAAALALVALPASSYLVLPASLREANVYNSVFTGVLPHSTEPAEAVADLGLDPELAARGGSDFYSTGALDDAALRATFFGRVDHLDVALHLLSHPATLLRLVGAATARMVELRPENLGTALESRGLPPGTKSATYEAYSDGRRALAPVSTPLLVAILTAGLAVPGLLLLRRRGAGGAISLPALTLAVALGAWISIGTVLVGDGLFELVKKLLLANALVDLLLAAGAAAAVGAVAQGTEGRAQLGREPAREPVSAR